MSAILSATAPSGAGKSTILAELGQTILPNFRSISWTTRQPRPYEKDGADYHFRTEEEFMEHVKQGGFAEWANFGGSLYGTPIAPIEEALRCNLFVLMDLEVQGATDFRLVARMRGWKLFDAFINVPSPSIKVLEERLRRRGCDTEGQILRRLEIGKGEIARANEFSFQFINDNLRRCVKEIVAQFEVFSKC